MTIHALLIASNGRAVARVPVTASGPCEYSSGRIYRGGKWRLAHPLRGKISLSQRDRARASHLPMATELDERQYHIGA